MLLFQKRFHPGLRDGSITLTFRQWQRPRVKAGGRYRVHPLGVLEVEDVRQVSLGEVTAADAGRAGFDSLQAFRQYLRRDAEAPPPDSLPLWRIRFHHGGDGDRVPGAMNGALSEAEVEALRGKLGRLDAAAPRPWTQRTLELIKKHPKRRAGDLADLMEREKLEFKADVIKLKRLGLTQSFEVGYGLTPRGRTLLDRLGDSVPRRAPGGRTKRARAAAASSSRRGTRRPGR